MNDKTRTLKLAFIGGSINSAVGYTHFVASRMDRKWELVAGCFSLNQSENNETADIYGVPGEKLYSNWQDLIEKEKNKIDSMVILTPSPDHYEIIVECLKNNVPVISEKPLSMEQSEALTISRLKKDKNGFLAITFNYSGYPLIREFRNLIEENYIGDVLHFQVEMPQEGFIIQDKNGQKIHPQEWRLSKSKIPIIHLDLAVHLHQLLYYLLREKPLEIISDMSSKGWFQDTIDNVSCICKYSTDISGQLWFSKSAIGYRNGLKLRIFGNKASIEWEQNNPEELKIAKNDGQKLIIDRGYSNLRIANQKRYNRFKPGHPSGYIEAFANIYYDIADCLYEYKENGSWMSNEIFSDALAMEGLQFLEAMSLSAQTKQWEKI